jgi:putative Mg2+ transporter-C (MgtC) family protein
MPAWISIEPFHWANIGTALFCGIIVGIERQLRGKPVGIRTAALITLGTYIFVQGAILANADHADIVRVIGQVVTGIGFLGAGVMLSKDGSVIGVTSAATIWILAAIGIVISLNYLSAAIKLSFIVIFILVGVEYLERHTRTFSRGVHAKYVASRKTNSEDNDVS